MSLLVLKENNKKTILLAGETLEETIIKFMDTFNVSFEECLGLLKDSVESGYELAILESINSRFEAGTLEYLDEKGKIKKFLAGAALAASMAMGLPSCSTPYDYSIDPYTAFNGWELPGNIKPRNLNKVFEITSTKVIWIDDDKNLDGVYGNFIKTPNETYTSGYGDCDDISLLAMELIKIMNKGKIDNMYFVTGDVKLENGKKIKHAFIKYNGKYYEPQNRDGTIDYDILKIDHEISYDKMVDYMKNEGGPFNFRNLK